MLKFQRSIRITGKLKTGLFTGSSNMNSIIRKKEFCHYVLQNVNIFLYESPAQLVTGLCPVTHFSGAPPRTQHTAGCVSGA